MREQPPEVTVEAMSQPEDVRQAEARIRTLIAPAEAVGQGAFDLARNAARRATVVAPVRLVLDWSGNEAREFMSLRESHALLVDTWAASGTPMLLRRIEALSPASRLRTAIAPLRAFRWAIRPLEPAFEVFCPGRIAPELVPPDRLVGGTGWQSDFRTVSCP
jgi:hypothetical protein